jgi:hypothetical protein
MSEIEVLEFKNKDELIKKLIYIINNEKLPPNRTFKVKYIKKIKLIIEDKEEGEYDYTRR